MSSRAPSSAEHEQAMGPAVRGGVNRSGASRDEAWSCRCLKKAAWKPALTTFGNVGSMAITEASPKAYRSVTGSFESVADMPLSSHVVERRGSRI